MMTRHLCSALLAVCAALPPLSWAWLNAFDEPVNFQCDPGQFLSHVSSQHNSHNEDRVWDFQCRAVPAEGAVTDCAWTNFVNDWDQPVTYQCPQDGFLAGIQSVHDNHHEDRRFKFRCCHVQGAVAHACSYTNWENTFDGVLDYEVPNGKILRGIESYHDNHYEDRRFQFQICDLD